MQGFLGALAFALTLFIIVIGGTYIIIELRKEPPPAIEGYNG